LFLKHTSNYDVQKKKRLQSFCFVVFFFFFLCVDANCLVRGEIVAESENSYVSRGTSKLTDRFTLRVTELPVGVWTQDYKEFLDGLVRTENSHVRSFSEHHTGKQEKERVVV
jgi:hypothetical protein